jgi:hypothetical protein
LVAIDAPESPIEIVQVQSGTGYGKPPNPTYQPCPVLGSGCLIRVDHSCQNNVNQTFFGDPALRLNTVVNSVMFHQITSICGNDLNATPDWSNALHEIGAVIQQRLKHP